MHVHNNVMQIYSLTCGAAGRLYKVVDSRADPTFDFPADFAVSRQWREFGHVTCFYKWRGMSVVEPEVDVPAYEGVKLI